MYKNVDIMSANPQALVARNSPPPPHTHFNFLFTYLFSRKIKEKRDENKEIALKIN